MSEASPPDLSAWTRAVVADQPKRIGRPSTYTEEVACEICEAVAGGAFLVDVCAEPGMPNVRTIHRWLTQHPEFARAYETARVIMAHVLAERAVKSGLAATADNYGPARVHFDAQRWLAGRLLPKVYGDKVDASLTTEVIVTTPEERRQRISALLAKQSTIDGVAIALDRAAISQPQDLARDE